MDIHPEELARQIALIDFELFRQIRPYDLFNKAWSRKDKETAAPNVCAMVDRFNEFSSWVTAEIVTVENLKERIAILGRWIEVAERCKSQNNYNAVMAIISALQNASVFRLKQTWNGLSASTRQTFEDLKLLLSREGNFRTIRKHLKQATPPCLPYLGMYLTDLTFIEDGNQDFIEELINFSKRRRLARVIKELQQYQQVPYFFQPVPFIQEFILAGVGLDESEAYTLSCVIEAKTGTMKVKNLSSNQDVATTIRERRNTTIERRKTQSVLIVDSALQKESKVVSPLKQTSMLVTTARSFSREEKEDAVSKRSRKIKELQGKFATAVVEGDLEKAQSLLLQGISLKDNKDQMGQTPLHIAAYHGHMVMVSYFLMVTDPSIGIPPIDAQDQSGWTALHCAASPGNLEICSILLTNKANPTIANKEGNLPLHFLCRRNPLQARIKKTKSKDKTPPVNPEDTPYIRVLKTMLESGVDINARNQNGETPLHQAAASGNVDGIRFLLRNKAKILAKTINEETPLMFAERAENPNPEAVQLLLEAELKKKERKSLLEHGDIKLDDIYSIAKLMMSDSGVTVKDRKQYFITYKKCFVGEEAVDWMMKQLPVRSREDAVALGQKLMDSHFILHVSKSNKAFRDGKYFYYFCETENDFQQMKAKLASINKETVSVSIDDFEVCKVLAQSDYGKVFLGKNKKTLQIYALKILDKQALVAEGELDMLMSEKRILQNDNAFLVHLHYSWETSKHIFLAMDFIGGGDLNFHLTREDRFTEAQAQFVAAELVLALEYLHSRGVVYRNLRPSNILLDREGHICLTDFGLSKIVSTLETVQMQTAVGSPAYSAPEILECQPYTRSVDWWSFGVVLYQMLLGFTPFEFENEDLGKLIRSILNCRILYPEELVSHNARSLLEAILQKNPAQRLDSVDEIKHHPFFSGIDWEALAVKKVPSPFKIEMKSDDDVSNFDWKYTSQEVGENFLETLVANDIERDQ